jgi:hypothetical protein
MRYLGLIAISVIACASATASAASGRGSIQGFIRDGRGNPLAGAAVLVMSASEDAKPEKVIRRANTNAEGKFLASGILPGRYKVKAEAAGFRPIEFPADVKPNKITIFDSILLRRINTLAEESMLNLDPKYSVRKANSTIFQHNPSEAKSTEADQDQSIALTDRDREFHGFVHAFTQTAWDQSARPASIGANFAVSQQIGKTDITVNGQVGEGPYSAQRLQAIATGHASDRHRLTVALGYGRFTFSRRNKAIGQFSVSATDTWQVSGPVLVVYGIEAARFTEGSGTSVLPRLGIAIDAGARTRLFAAMVPGSSVDAQSRVDFESGEIVFEEPRPIAFAPDGQPLADRSYRLQFGGQHTLSDKSSIEMMAFFDTISGHGVGLLAIPFEGETSERSESLSGRSRGVRVVYHHRINRILEGSVGYAFGEGQHLDPRGITEPAEMFRNDTYHVFSARVDANFVSTGTKVSTVLRLAPERAIFAIDPFQGQIAAYDPNLNISLTQDLPVSGFLPGQWQAVIDLRNLLDQQPAISDERQEILASRFHRLIRIGISLRF